jgi:hypothetical protein
MYLKIKITKSIFLFGMFLNCSCQLKDCNKENISLAFKWNNFNIDSIGYVVDTVGESWYKNDYILHVKPTLKTVEKNKFSAEFMISDKNKYNSIYLVYFIDGKRNIQKFNNILSNTDTIIWIENKKTIPIKAKVNNYNSLIDSIIITTQQLDKQNQNSKECYFFSIKNLHEEISVIPITIVGNSSYLIEYNVKYKNSNEYTFRDQIYCNINSPDSLILNINN